MDLEDAGEAKMKKTNEYQINGNHACSNIVANTLPSDAHSTLGCVQKVKTYHFQNVSILLIVKHTNGDVFFV